MGITMAKIKGKKIYLKGITSSEAFAEASREELRALVALAEANGELASIEALAKAAGISKLRAAAAVTLWEEAGVFEEKDADIEYEFSEDLSDGIDTESAAEVAASLRNGRLKELIGECQSLMGRAALNSSEVKRITALVTQLGLTEEYVLTLAAYLEEKGSLTALKLYKLGEELSGRGIDTTEDLQIWIQEKNNKPLPHHVEFCKGMGYGIRALTRTEKEYADKWVLTFGFNEPIIAEAVDIASVNTSGNKPLSYINKLLEAWHSADCKTVEECRTKYAKDKPVPKKKQRKKSDAGKNDGDTPRFSDFNTEDALMKALERSYGKANEKK